MNVLKKAIGRFKAETVPRISSAKAAAVTGLLALFAALPASANGTSIEDLGNQAAVQIAKFTIAIGAVGASIMTVVVLIQGFRIVFGMIKTGR